MNRRALDLLRQNAGACGAANVRAATPDEVPREVTFAAIYSNPPVKIGKDAMRDLLRRWLARLAPAAPAYLVVKKNLGADALADWLTADGCPTLRLCSKRGYRVLIAENGVAAR